MSQPEDSLSRRTFLWNTWLQVGLVATPLIYMLANLNTEIAILKVQQGTITSNQTKLGEILERVDERSRSNAAHLEAIRAAEK